MTRPEVLPCPDWCVGHEDEERLFCLGEEEVVTVGRDRSTVVVLQNLRNFHGQLSVTMCIEREKGNGIPRYASGNLTSDDCALLGLLLSQRAEMFRTSESLAPRVK